MTLFTSNSGVMDVNDGRWLNDESVERSLSPATMQLLLNEFSYLEGSDSVTASWLKLLSIVQEHGQAAVRVRDDSGQTALHLAAQCAKSSYCELLLHRGAEVDAKTTSHQWTPLHHCADGNYGHEKVATMLLHYGADVNAKDKAGETPLFHAARFGHVELVNVLIGFGADVNARDNEGSTGSSPLCEAACSGSLEVVKALVQAGANPDPDPSGISLRPEYLAHFYGMDEIYEYLRGIRLEKEGQLG